MLCGVNKSVRECSMFFAYILQCSDGTLYVGSTNDLSKRLKEHNNSKNGAHYTKIRRPVELVHSEMCETYGLARAKEAEWKRLTRGQKLEIIKKVI